jgi:predicted nucleic acid-binding protein
VIVLDASAAVDLLLELEPQASWVARRLRDDPHLHAPSLIDLEVASALRKLVRRRVISPARGRISLRDLAATPIDRYPPTALLERVWDLRGSLTAYDAAYVALAEALGAVLLTTDDLLARSRGHRAVIESFPG